MSEYFELKSDIGYSEELCKTIPFKVCSVEQMIWQTEESLHPEEILANEEDVLEVKKSFKNNKEVFRISKRIWLLV